MSKIIPTPRVTNSNNIVGELSPLIHKFMMWEEPTISIDETKTIAKRILEKLDDDMAGEYFTDDVRISQTAFIIQSLLFGLSQARDKEEIK